MSHAGPASSTIPPVKTVSLGSPKGFILFDVADAPVSVGVARSAKNVLQSSATNLARSVTYALAAFEIQGGGASAGVNVVPEDRQANVAALVAKAIELAEGGRLALDPDVGIDEADLAELRLVDPRPGWLRGESDGLPVVATLVAAGSLAAAEAVGGGGRVAIDGFGSAGLALARSVVDRGGSVVAVSSRDASAFNANGFPLSDLEAALAAADPAKALTEQTKPAWAVFGADADVLFVGSKIGALTHDGTPHVKARAVVPLGPVPLTTKALIHLQRAGVAVVPDFLAVAGPHLAGLGGAGDSASTAAKAVAEAVSEAVRHDAAHADGLYLGACQRAEAFLRSWSAERPFGRPLA